MTDKFFISGGIHIHYLDYPGGEPTVVLLPGLTANAHIFDGLIEAGLSPPFHVLALDLRGRGKSDAPPAGFDPAAPAANYSMADHAADVIGFLDGLDIHHPVLVGHSFGGMLALYLAAHFPERFPRIVVLDWAMALATPATRELLKPTLARLGQVAPSWEAYLAAMKQMPFYHGWWDPTIERFYRADILENSDGSVQPRPRPDAIQAALEGTLIEDWPALLAKVRQPVLLLNAQDPYGPPAQHRSCRCDRAMATVEALANVRYVAVPGNHITMLFGHNVHRVVEAMTTFLHEAMMTFIRSGDLDVHYLEHGSGIPIVFVHGNWATSSWWEPVLARLPDGWRGIAYDLRGRGRTAGPDSDYSIPSLAADLRVLRRCVGARLVAPGRALARRRHRDAVRARSPGAGPLAHGDRAGVGRRAARGRHAPEWQRALKANRAMFGQALKALAPTVPDDGYWKRLVSEGHAQRLSAALGAIAALADWKPGDRLRSISCPKLVISGEQDILVTAPVVERAAEALGAHRVTIPGIGHSVNIEAPDLLLLQMKRLINNPS